MSEDKTRETEIRETPEGLRFVINWYMDEDGDTSWLGEFTDDLNQEWVIDRQQGILYGAYTGEIDEETGEEPREEFKTGIHDYADRNSFRGWKPGDNHCPPGKDWKRPLTKEDVDWLAEHGHETPETADLEAILADYQTMVQLNRGSIWFEGYVVEMFYAGQLLDHDSCWGFLEIDEAYRKETIDTSIDEMQKRSAETLQLAITRHEKHVSELREILAKLEKRGDPAP